MWRNAREPDRRSSAAGDRSAALYWAVLGFVAVVEIVPLFVVKYLPLVDLPNHEARIAILAHYGSNPTMQKFYVVDWRPIPDLAFDLFSVPLVRIGLTPVEAGRLFLALSALLYVAGGHLLAKSAAGRRSWLGVILPLLFYGSLLFYGFINFVFGFGVFLVAYALWLPRRAEMTYGRVAALSALLVVAYLSHLAAFGLLSIAIIVTVVFDWALRRTARVAAARSLLSFVPSLVLLGYGALARGGRGGVAWGSPKEKVSVLGGMFLSYDHRLDALWIGGIVVVAVVAVVLSRSIAIEPSFATLAIVFGLVFLLLPPTLITASNVDARIVPAATAFALCAVRLSLTPRVAATLAICVVALATGRVAVIAVQWRDMSNTIAAQVQFLDAALPRNADVYSLFPEGGPQIDKRTRSYAHLASYATIDRNAHVSRTFAERSQQPLVSRVDELAAIDAVAPFTVNLATFRRYTYLWTYKPGAVVRRQLQGRCVRVYDRGGFYLCRRSASG